MLRVNGFFSLFIILLAGLLLWQSPAHAQIDLHAHLHMKPGLGLFLQGTWEDEPRANHWSEKIQTRASEKSLASMTSRPKLIVLSLYGHPYFGYSWKRDGFHFDRKENVRRAVEQEYQEFVKFVAANSDRFAIAKSAREARQILKTGKTAIILSLEGAWGTLDSPEDFHRWIDERGLAIVTPVHLTPDHLGGNALMAAFVSFTNSTFDFLKSVWTSRGECLKTFCKSTEGFTPEGEKLVDELMMRKVWIDVAHSNEQEVESILRKYGSSTRSSSGSSPGRSLPLLCTHTQLREFFPAERGLGQAEINYIRKNDGIVGLIPSQYMMPEAMKSAMDLSAKNHPEEKEAPSASHGLSCISGLDVFKNTIKYAIAKLGSPDRVALGSDINAPLDGLSPGCGTPANLSGAQCSAQQMLSCSDPEAMFDLHRRGFYTYSQWNILTEYLSPESSWSTRHLDHFLTLWEMVRP